MDANRLENIDKNMTPDDIRLLDIYFQSIRFNQVRSPQGNIKLDIKHKFEIAKSNDKKNLKLTMTTFIQSEDIRIDMELKSVAVFRVLDNTEINPTFPQIMVNTLFPYVRSQVSLLTTQPGLVPIMLPLITPKIDMKIEETVFA
ncbi:protein-export chaperone SecB [bacterium]|nr:protein-export chaperone SecB [bacterium]